MSESKAEAKASPPASPVPNVAFNDAPRLESKEERCPHIHKYWEEGDDWDGYNWWTCEIYMCRACKWEFQIVRKAIIVSSDDED